MNLMLPAALALLALLLPVATLGCSCVNPTPCELLQNASADDVIFVGRVTVDSGEQWGTRNAIVEVEQVFHGLPANSKSVEVNSMSGTSCYYPLKDGQRYVLFASRLKDRPSVLLTGECAGNFRVVGNEPLLDALRSAKANKSTLVGQIFIGNSQDNHLRANVPIVISGGESPLKATTLSNGYFTFPNLSPGKYTVSLPDPALIDTSRDARQAVVPPGSCGYHHIFAAINSRIAGTIRSGDGPPLPGVTVDAFQIDEDGTRSSARSQATSNEKGQYLLTGLAPAEYVVAVNGNNQASIAFPPTFHPATRAFAEAGRIELGLNKQAEAIDIVVPPARTPAQLRITAVFNDGTPASEFHAWIKDELDNRVADLETKQSVLDAKVYMGETVNVSVTAYEDPDTYRSSEGETGLMKITGPQTTIQVRLRPQARSPALKEQQ